MPLIGLNDFFLFPKTKFILYQHFNELPANVLKLITLKIANNDFLSLRVKISQFRFSSCLFFTFE